MAQDLDLRMSECRERMGEIFISWTLKGGTCLIDWFKSFLDCRLNLCSSLILTRCSSVLACL